MWREFCSLGRPLSNPTFPFHNRIEIGSAESMKRIKKTTVCTGRGLKKQSVQEETMSQNILYASPGTEDHVPCCFDFIIMCKSKQLGVVSYFDFSLRLERITFPGLKIHLEVSKVGFHFI